VSPRGILSPSPFPVASVEGQEELRVIMLTQQYSCSRALPTNRVQAEGKGRSEPTDSQPGNTKVLTGLQADRMW
jgi:hypothetical protein